MKSKVLLFGLLYIIPVTGLSATALASNCLTGGCHQNLTEMKHMHGPIGAEMAGVQGCIMCHIPAGSACNPTVEGKFKIKNKGLCQICHDKGSSSKHANASSNCLKCHNPHGSNTSPYMLRSKL